MSKRTELVYVFLARPSTRPCKENAVSFARDYSLDAASYKSPDLCKPIMFSRVGDSDEAASPVRARERSVILNVSGYSLAILILAMLVQCCQDNRGLSSIDPVNWVGREVNYSLVDTLTEGVTYLSVYSQIYSQTEHKTHDLTATVSMRNTNRKDTIFIEKAEYFDTKGKLIRTYFDHTIFIAPMETVEIIIDEDDKDGGTGANFLFEWKIRPETNEPLFEGIMISTSGQQGLSFTTQGKRVN